MKKYETELLIIGGGAAGLSAAAAASEAGIKTTIVECNAAVGGNGVFPRGIFAVDSVIQRRNLIFADVDQVFTNCMNYAHWKIDGRIIRRILNKTGDTISWLMKMGVPFTEAVHHLPNQTPEVFHITNEKEPVGTTVVRALHEFCKKNQVEILTSTKGKQLLLDEDGAVCGAACITENGSELQINAKKVIICTGGFGGNKKMVSEFLPELNYEEVMTFSGMAHMGAGISMAMDAGADIEGHFTLEIAAPRVGGHAPLNSLIGKPYNIWLNCFGKRFADEGIVYNFPQAANACMRQPKSLMWVVFDQHMMDQTLEDGMDIIEKIHIPEHSREMLTESMEAAIQHGVLCKSNSLEELADFIGCDRAVFESSIKEYNQYCQSGRDKIFAKAPMYLIPLNNPPYYAIKSGTTMINTHGGIRVDEEFHALKANYDKVPNLYVAGVDFGGADADIYNVNMSGHGFGFAVNSGRIAGENAAREIRE